MLCKGKISRAENHLFSPSVVSVRCSCDTELRIRIRPYSISGPIMVLILDGNSEIGAHVYSEIGHFICYIHLLRSTNVVGLTF